MKAKIAKRKIILTGGHAARTGLAVIEEIRNRKSLNNWELYWIGSKYAFEGQKTNSMEYAIFPKEGVKFINLTTGRIQRKFTKFTIVSLLKIPLGMIQAFIILLCLKPNLILSFGGYAAFPVVFWGKILGIPVIIHEQTAVIGRANKASLPFSTKVAVARNSSKQYIPNSKLVVTGNPMPKKILDLKQKVNISKPPVIFVTGGSRGSVTLNSIVLESLEFLLTKYKVIHQSGELDFEKCVNFRKYLPEKLIKRYEVLDFIDPKKIDKYYQKADLIVARSGANTVSDILMSKTPSILVPIPFTYLNEQHLNAEYVQNLGLGVIIEQNELNKDNLINKIDEIISNWKIYKERFKKVELLDLGASEKLVDLLVNTLDEKIS